MSVNSDNLLFYIYIFVKLLHRTAIIQSYDTNHNYV